MQCRSATQRPFKNAQKLVDGASGMSVFQRAKRSRCVQIWRGVVWLAVHLRGYAATVDTLRVACHP
jgi:hypothetical protein